MSQTKVQLVSNIVGNVSGGASFTGIVTAGGGFNLGISSGGTTITSGPVKTLNFVGTGNTFAVSGTTVDISISGGSGANYWVQTAAGIHTLGNVGVGTTNPQTKLEINGILGFSTSLGINGFLAGNIRIGDKRTGANLVPSISANPTTGINNIFIGLGVGAATTSGHRNIFVGNNVGFNNTTGNSNSFFGNGAGYYNTSGYYNNFFGNTAGYYNTSGYCNNFFGPNAGYYQTTGTFNSFFGSFAGLYNSTGQFNNFFGAYSGISTSASNKIIIGSGYDYSNLFDSPDTTKDTQFAVGVRTDANPSKYWLVGNENFNIGIGTTNPTSKLVVAGNVFVSGIITANDYDGNFILDSYLFN